MDRTRGEVCCSCSPWPGGWRVGSVVGVTWRDGPFVGPLGAGGLATVLAGPGRRGRHAGARGGAGLTRPTASEVRGRSIVGRHRRSRRAGPCTDARGPPRKPLMNTAEAATPPSDACAASRHWIGGRARRQAHRVGAAPVLRPGDRPAGQGRRLRVGRGGRRCGRCRHGGVPGVARHVPLAAHRDHVPHPQPRRPATQGDRGAS